MRTEAIFILWLMFMSILASASGQQTAEELYNKGVSSDQEGKYDEALQAFDKAIETDPQFALAWYKKGIILFNQSKYGSCTSLTE